MEKQAREKDPAAVSLGTRGGNASYKKRQATPGEVKRMAKMGGEARAKALTPERRREIAQAAVRARWEKKRAGMMTDTEFGVPF